MAPHPTVHQLESLVEFLEQNPGIAKGLLRTKFGKIDVKNKWAAFATSVNALGGANKDGAGWSKYWAEKKCTLKKHCAQNNASIRRTGGGPAEDLPQLTPLDSRLIAVMGGQEFAIGDVQFLINPFSTSATIESTSAGVQDPEIIMMQGTSSSADLQENVERNRSPIMFHREMTQDGNHTPQPSLGRRQNRAGNHQSTYRMGNELKRLAEIESRRVEAEVATAQAFADLGVHIQRIAAAQESMASSFATAAAAIIELLKGQQTPARGSP